MVNKKIYKKRAKYEKDLEVLYKYTPTLQRSLHKEIFAFEIKNTP